MANCHLALFCDLLKSVRESIQFVDRGHGEDHPYTTCARIAGGVLPCAADSTIQPQSDF